MGVGGVPGGLVAIGWMGTCQGPGHGGARLHGPPTCGWGAHGQEEKDGSGLGLECCQGVPWCGWWTAIARPMVLLLGALPAVDC